MRRWERIIVALVFVAWLVAPLVLLALGGKSDFAALENRRPARAPAVTLAAVTDPQFYAAVARTFGDRVPLRAEALALDSWIDLEVFGDSPNPEVLVGADDWLYLFDAVAKPCVDRIPPWHAVANLRRISRILEASGRRLVVAVAPDKVSIYPERLGPSVSLSRCSRKYRLRLRTFLRQAELPGYVDLWQGLEDLKARAAEDVYWAQDTHWTFAGALEATRLIVDRLDPGLWNESAVKPRARVRHRGDLARMIGLPTPREATRYDIQRRVQVTLARSGRFRRMTVACRADCFRPRVLVVIDSFGELFVGNLAQYLEESTWVRWSQLPGEGLAAIVDELAGAEVVIFESVERMAFVRFARFSRDLPARLIDRLRDELPVTDLDVVSVPSSAGPPRLELELPAVAPDADRYLVIDVASSPAGAAAGRLSIAMRRAENLRWQAVRGLEVGSGAGVRRLVAELPNISLTVQISLRSDVVRSVGCLVLPPRGEE
jgi:SGNH hydrolase-like domain, acetyltransferase AlgX